MTKIFSSFPHSPARMRADFVDKGAALLDEIKNTLFEYRSSRDQLTLYDVDDNLEVAIEDIIKGRTDQIVVDNLIAILKRLRHVRDLLEEHALFNGK